MTRRPSSGKPWPPPGLSRNAARLADALRVHGPSTRAELGTATRTSRPTVASGLAELATHALVGEHAGAEPNSRGAGRPAAVVRLTRLAGLVVGVDIGRRNLRVLVADLGRDEVGHVQERLSEEADTRALHVFDQSAALVQRALIETDSDLDDVIGVGVGIPAPLTRDGTIGSPTLLPAWANLRPRAEFSQRLQNVAVKAENDASLGALGEYLFGAGQGSDEMTYLQLATGVGSGKVLDGRLHRGASGTAGEFGHITLDTNGPVCPCGNRGCVELYAGGVSLVRQARDAHESLAGLADLADLVQRATDSDGICRTLVAEAGGHLGVALGTLVNLDNPDRVVVGGDLVRAGEILLRPLRESMHRTAMAAAANAAEIRAGTLGDWATAWGGAGLILTSPLALGVDAS